ncbi:hypothetical protein J9303_08480 [Bacillaceae bacterium Marseille-Q3522]|nr:hypothetical protein [Bacillaceae bacterium Marseille-Q3522]
MIKELCKGIIEEISMFKKSKGLRGKKEAGGPEVRARKNTTSSEDYPTSDF